jgi:hypothetical protein
MGSTLCLMVYILVQLTFWQLTFWQLTFWQLTFWQLTFWQGQQFWQSQHFDRVNISTVLTIDKLTVDKLEVNQMTVNENFFDEQPQQPWTWANVNKTIISNLCLCSLLLQDLDSSECDTMFGKYFIHSIILHALYVNTFCNLLWKCLLIISYNSTIEISLC